PHCLARTGSVVRRAEGRRASPGRAGGGAPAADRAERHAQYRRCQDGGAAQAGLSGAAFCNDQSIFAPDCSTALPQRGISDFTKSPSSAGEVGDGSAPLASSLSRNAGSVSALRAAAFQTSMTSFGVPFGAHRPSHAVTVKPGTAASDSVGMLGASGQRFAVVTARPLSLPSRTSEYTLGMISIIICTWPDSRSILAGPPPR